MADFFFTPDVQTSSNLWIILIGALTNIACALLGCFLVLRRMSLLGDAISHAVLPGLVVGFLLSGSVNLPIMFLGALCAGLLTTVLTQVIHRQGGIPADASMGVVFTSLFALGVILVHRFGQGVDLDPDCLLHGELELATFKLVEITENRFVPRALLSIAIVLAINFTVIVLFWKELKITSFDPALATTMGISAAVMHYLLMSLVALTAVASFEQVGSILVVAMFITPGATAHLLSDRLKTVLILASLTAGLSSVGGFLLADFTNSNTAGAMAVTVGLFYLAAVIGSPRYGLVSRILRMFRNSFRIVREDLLAMLYRLEELGVVRPMAAPEARQAIGGGVLASTVVRWSLWTGHLSESPTGLQLTEKGRQRAITTVRSHRLWEAYLVEYLRLPLDHVHDPAAHMEHYIDRDLQQRIEADLEHTQTDPHGRTIPEAGCPPEDDP